MSFINLKPSLNKKSLLTSFLIVCCLFIAVNLFSWNRNSIQVGYSKADNAILIRFEFFDYEYGPANENGYLEWCDFYYSTSSGVKDKFFMKSETNDQGHDNWSWVNMEYKLNGTQQQFLGCYSPASGTMWPDGSTQHVEVYNILDKAYLTIKWYLNSTYQNINSIRILGRWFVNGVWPSEGIDESYTVPKGYLLNPDNLNRNNSSVKTNLYESSENTNDLKIYKEADAVVIKGSVTGERIKVYSTSGTEIKSIISNDDVIKIRLPANQIYIVHVGQSHYKVAL